MTFDNNKLYIGILLLVFIYLVYNYINSTNQPQGNGFINISIPTETKPTETITENYRDYQKLGNDESIIYNGESYKKVDEGTYELDQSI